MKFKKALVLALALTASIPGNIAFADEEIDIAEEEINVGERDWVYETKDSPYKLDGLDYTFETLYGHLEPGPGFDIIAVNLDEFKKAVDGRSLDFIIVDEADYSLKVKKRNTDTIYEVDTLNSDGKKYLNINDFAKKLGFRHRFEQVSEDNDDYIYLLNSDKSNIKSLSLEEFKDHVQSMDYTIIFPYDHRDPEIERMEEYADFLSKQNAYRTQIIGLFKDYENYSLDEESSNYENNAARWTVYGLNDEINEYLQLKKTGMADLDYPFSDIIIMDKDLNILGESLFYYQIELGNYYYNLPENKDISMDTLEEVAKLAKYNFLDYAVSDRDPDESDRYILKDGKVIRNNLRAKDKLIEVRENLKKAINDNKLKVESANFLLEYTPKTVAKVKDKLESLVERSLRLQKEAQKEIDKIDAILEEN